MRRLDQLLSDAAVRGDRMGPDWVIEHLEHRLAGERAVVVGLDRKLREASAPTWRKRVILALAGFAVLVMAVVAVGFLTRDSNPEEVADRAALAHIQEFAERFRQGDLAGVGTMGPAGIPNPLSEWLIGLRAEPEFTNCEITGRSSNGRDIRCAVTYGDEYFFSQVAGGPVSTSIRAGVSPDGIISVTHWPPQEGLVEAAAQFRVWLEEFHPESAELIAGYDYAGLAWSLEGAEESMRLLPDYLLSLRSE